MTAPRSVVVLSTSSAASDLLGRALLAAPGVVDVTAAFPGDAAVPGAAPSVGQLLGEADRGRWSPDVEVRPLVLAPVGTPVALVQERFPDADLVHVHHEPAPDDAGWAGLARPLLDDLDGWDGLVATSVENLAAEPETETQRLCAALGLGWHVHMARVLREEMPAGAVPTAATHHDADTRALVERSRALAPAATPSLQPTSAPGALTAHDRGLARLMEQLGGSLLVTTYQSNRVLSLRPENGGLGIHMRAFERPMGVALTPQGLALGTRSEIVEFRNLAPAAAALEPAGTWDACLMPRTVHVTGDIAVHDLAVGKAGLWLVATNFNCLATLDGEHSFVPQWRPPFVSGIVAEDRCHLNGMAMVDGAPRYVTALGTSDTVGGWRADKASGGVVMAVPSGKVVLDGLAMPHSPRWHEGRLYVLESGRGRLLRVDPASGRAEVVVELPGFTRGLSLVGPVAFVGTSQIRETATFGGLPVAERAPLECGVWAVDLETGKVLAQVTFADRIQELFEVVWLPGVRKPEIGELGSDLVRTSWMVPPQA